MSGTSIEDANGSDHEITTIEVYRAHLPYATETPEEMKKILESIVARIVVCVRAKEWEMLGNWTHRLQGWMSLRYPMPRKNRAQLAKLYYGLCILPGIEPNRYQEWADILSQLVYTKPGNKRRLELGELQLDWFGLWERCRREIWPSQRAVDSGRNVMNILLHVAETSRLYYHPSETPKMLDEFVPLITRDSIQTMILVITSFISPSHPGVYMPALFKIWEAFNSTVLDDRLIHVMGNLAEEHCAGKQGRWAEGGAERRSVGIFTEQEWVLLMSKCLGSMESLAVLLVYSMAVDGPVRDHDSNSGFLAGSRALDSLDKLITSVESFFHPSNAGQWTLVLVSFLQRITYEFNRRWHEETKPDCKTPKEWRLTNAMRHAFVKVLKTPALLAIFSKDQVASSFAQGSLKSMVMLEPQLIMPEILERAYSGLETVNETHRTTVVMNSLTGIAMPLASLDHWAGGQKHIVPLLELSIPGIDLNDPGKTVCSCMLIVSVLQYVKIGDLTQFEAPPLPEGSRVQVDTDPDVPAGPFTPMNAEEEDSLTRQSTGAFSGRKFTFVVMSEQVLKALRSALDVVTYHLSNPMFDLVLNLVFDYASTNARANSIRAFGYVVACLARAKPKVALAKFVPHCVRQVEIELTAGASSVRTTSAHAVISSDTTLLWNMAILRGILGYGGAELLEHKADILKLFKLLVQHCYNERGYSGTGRIISKIMHTLSSIYPLHSYFLNTEDWYDSEMEQAHNRKWGTVMEAKDAVLEWHIPSAAEIGFVIQILEEVVEPSLRVFNGAIDAPDSQRDGVWRNDLCRRVVNHVLRQNIPDLAHLICRHLHVIRSAWSGLATVILIDKSHTSNPLVDEEIETEELIPQAMTIQSGFALQDSSDKRYQQVLSHRARFGELLHRAAVALKTTDTEDHIDLVMSVLRGIDTYLLDYGVTRDTYAGVKKQYDVSKQLTRLHAKQKCFPRLVWIKRAQSYHALRCHFSSMYRRRSELDDNIINDLFDFSVSAYTRIRRQAQAVLHTIIGYFVRSTRMVMARAFEELNNQVKLEKSSDPDRMKGALHVMWNKSVVIPKLAPELVETYSLAHEDSRLDGILEELENNLLPSNDRALLKTATAKRAARISRHNADYATLTNEIAQVCLKPRTHWRYLQFGLRVLSATLRKDLVPSKLVVQAFAGNATSDFSTLRWYAQRGIVKMMKHVKMRTYSPNDVYGPLINPLQRQVPVRGGSELLADLRTSFSYGEPSMTLVDWTDFTGFLAWTPSIKGYAMPLDNASLSWDPTSGEALDIIEKTVSASSFWQKLGLLYSQESSRGNSTIELRTDNVDFIKTVFKMFESVPLKPVLTVAEELWQESDKFKQRAAGELLAGAMRGSKHWPKSAHAELWAWIEQRLPQMFDQIKPDNVRIWEGILANQLTKRDPRRHPVLVDFIKNLPVDFDNESAFYVNKTITTCGILTDELGPRLGQWMDRYLEALFDNISNTHSEWHPSYPSVSEFLDACRRNSDPLRIREATHMEKIQELVVQFPKWRLERLPPPKVNQSEYDKRGLTVLQWIWSAGHSSMAPLIFPYVMPLLPELFQMSNLNDSSELMTYSNAVLYLLSAVTPPLEFVEPIVNALIEATTSSPLWRVRLNALPILQVFYFRNLPSMSDAIITRIVDVLLLCLKDDNVEVRQMAAKTLAGVLRCSKRSKIPELKDRFVRTVKRSKLPDRKDAEYASAIRTRHSAILGLCSLIDVFPYSVEKWMPPLCEVLARHTYDPAPISATIRKCASDFKKSHTVNQLMFDEDQAAAFSTMLSGTSYCESRFGSGARALLLKLDPDA
ncbi:hypothetical protein FRC10_007440 [Ceratobasidium sp. 414]|nr:hypothetical protein FRC10_007440 [Ceratobasidium sp. 414]